MLVAYIYWIMKGKGHHENNGFEKSHQQSGISQSKQIV